MCARILQSLLVASTTISVLEKPPLWVLIKPRETQKLPIYISICLRPAKRGRTTLLHDPCYILEKQSVPIPRSQLLGPKQFSRTNCAFLPLSTKSWNPVSNHYIYGKRRETNHSSTHSWIFHYIPILRSESQTRSVFLGLVVCVLALDDQWGCTPRFHLSLPEQPSGVVTQDSVSHCCNSLVCLRGGDIYARYPCRPWQSTGPGVWSNINTSADATEGHSFGPTSD